MRKDVIEWRSSWGDQVSPSMIAVFFMSHVPRPTSIAFCAVRSRAKLKLVKRIVLRPVASAGRKPNKAYRTREHLTESEIAKLLAALKANRHGYRDWLIGLLIYRHGLRVSEACDLRWDDLDLPKRTIAIRRLKGSVDSVHYLERDELAGLKPCLRCWPVRGWALRFRPSSSGTSATSLLSVRLCVKVTSTPSLSIST